jgi:hypothetical protein
VKQWLTIWTRPKLTVRKLADAGDEGLRVAVLLGVLEGYRYFSLGKPLFEPSLLFLRNFWPSVAATSALAGAIGSVMFVWVGGEVLPWVGRLFGAHSASNEVRTALCWSLVPLLLSSS